MAGTTQASTSLLAICSVTVTSAGPAVAGAPGAGTTATYYFQSSSLYKEAGFTAATGVKYINPDEWTGTEPLISVEQLILSGKLERVYAELTNPVANKPNKVIPFFVTPDKLVSVKTSATGVINKVFKKTRGGVTVTLGTCFGVRGKTSNRYR
jgi:hypothetical protein